MITLLTGSPGHGKSYTLVREIERAVGKGQPVATNVPLADNWPEIMARRHTLFGRLRPEAVQRKADEFRKLVVVTSDFSTLLRVRLAGEGEGRGKLVLDEAQRWMNTRGWDNALNPDGTVMKRAEALAARMRVLNHLSGHRHYGLDVILATQSQKAIDTQARDLYEFHSEVRNMRKLPWIGLFIRFNLFVKVTRWNDHSKSKAGVDSYFLSKSLARLYQTHALQDTDWPDDAIVLPMDSPPPTVNGNGSKPPPLPDSSLFVGQVARLDNGQLVTITEGNKEKFERALNDPPPDADPPDETPPTGVRSLYMK
jgi:Zonular occludens toxin (Zot)